MSLQEALAGFQQLTEKFKRGQRQPKPVGDAARLGKKTGTHYRGWSGADTRAGDFQVVTFVASSKGDRPQYETHVRKTRGKREDPKIIRTSSEQGAKIAHKRELDALKKANECVEFIEVSLAEVMIEDCLLEAAGAESEIFDRAPLEEAVARAPWLSIAHIEKLIAETRKFYESAKNGKANRKTLQGFMDYLKMLEKLKRDVQNESPDITDQVIEVIVNRVEAMLSEATTAMNIGSMMAINSRAPVSRPTRLASYDASVDVADMDVERKRQTMMGLVKKYGSVQEVLEMVEHSANGTATAYDLGQEKTPKDTDDDGRVDDTTADDDVQDKTDASESMDEARGSQFKQDALKLAHSIERGVQVIQSATGSWGAYFSSKALGQQFIKRAGKKIANTHVDKHGAVTFYKPSTVDEGMYGKRKAVGMTGGSGLRGPSPVRRSEPPSSRSTSSGKKKPVPAWRRSAKEAVEAFNEARAHPLSREWSRANHARSQKIKKLAKKHGGGYDPISAASVARWGPQHPDGAKAAKAFMADLKREMPGSSPVLRTGSKTQHAIYKATNKLARSRHDPGVELRYDYEVVLSLPRLEV